MLAQCAAAVPTQHDSAIGVMATVSGVELWWHSAAEQHDFLGITAALAAGAVLFAVLDPLLPKHGEQDPEGTPPVAARDATSQRVQPVSGPVSQTS